MKQFSLIILVLFYLSCQDSKVEESGISGSKEIMDNDLLDKKIDSLYGEGVFNGFATSIVDSTGILFNKGYGFADIKAKKPYTENTIINIASVSKVFIGVSVLKAQELGLIQLDDPINKYLPFKVINPHNMDSSITIRHLATHTSAITDQEIYMKSCYINNDNVEIEDSLKTIYGTYYQNDTSKWMPLNDYLKELLSQEGNLYSSDSYADRRSGKIYEYSNIGAALCALVIESAAQMPFNEFTQKHILKPLNMRSSAWLMKNVDQSNYSKLYADSFKLPYYTILSYPDGGLITSNTDLSQFLIELIRGYYGKGNILNQLSYQELYKPQLGDSAFVNMENANKGYNTGLFLDFEPMYHVVGHTGGDPGVNSFMFFNTETGKGRILITNTDSQKENSGDVFYGIWNAMDL